MKTVKIIECGSCGCWHREAFTGDCREDSERFDGMEDAANRLGLPVIEVFEDGSTCNVPVYPQKRTA